MDKKLINTATVNTEEPTPGYLFKVLIEMTFVDITTVHRLVEYLIAKVTDSVDKEFSYTLIKTLKIIRQLCQSGHVEFQNVMQQHVDVLKSAVMYRGGFSQSDGNALGKQIKTCAREAIDALFVMRKQEPIRSQVRVARQVTMSGVSRLDGQSSRDVISVMYRQQHTRSAYVAPHVPLALSSDHLREPESPQTPLPEPQFSARVASPTAGNQPNQVVTEFISTFRDIETSDLNRLYDKCLKTAPSGHSDDFWKEACLSLNDALSTGRRLDSKLNAVKVIEFFLKKGVSVSKHFFDENRTRLDECRNAAHFSLRKTVEKIFEMLPPVATPEVSAGTTKTLCDSRGESANISSLIKETTSCVITQSIVAKKLEERNVPKPMDKTRLTRRQPLVAPARRVQPSATTPTEIRAPSTQATIDDLFASVTPHSCEAEAAAVSTLSQPTSEASKSSDFSDLHDLMFGEASV